jgi:hypothetical protein
MPDLDYRGLAAIIIAVALGSTLVIGVLSVAWRGRALSQQGTDVLIAIGSALAGSLSTYIGGRIANSSSSSKE